MPLAKRCPTGPFSMTPHRGAALAPPHEGPPNLLGMLRSPIQVIALRPDKLSDKVIYRGVTYLPGQRFTVDPLDLPELVRLKKVQPLDDLPVPHWWDAPGRILQCEPGPASVWTERGTVGSLKIAQLTGYDLGNAAYRFHSAVNEYSDHCAAFIRWLTTNNNPFNCPTQWNATTEPKTQRALVLDADVLPCHVDFDPLKYVGLGTHPRPGQLLIRHYHCTQFSPDGKQLPAFHQVPMQNAASDDITGATLVGARLTLCDLRPGKIHWLPITVPVARYAAM